MPKNFNIFSDEEEEKEEKPKTIFSPKKKAGKYKIVLVAPTYIVINNDGNNQSVTGNFSGKKIGDEIELDL